MKMKNIVDAINKASRSIANVFGLQSLQYRQLKNVIMSNLPDVMVSTAKKGYLRLSKSKQSLRGLSYIESDVNEVMNFLKGVDRLDKNGKRMPFTPLQLAKMLDPTMTASRLASPTDLQRIRTISMGMAATEDIVEDYYDAKEDVIDSRTREYLRQLYRDRKGLKDEAAEEAYIKACNAVRDALINQSNNYADIIAKETAASKAAYQTPTTLAETYGNQMGGIIKK